MTPHESDRLEEQGRGLRRLARALVADPGAADDAVQDAYVLALDRDASTHKGAWLRGVVRNKLRERRRSDARRQAREQRRDGQAPPTAADETAAGIEMQARVMAALARVPEPHRTCVWLRYIAGREPIDIAETLEIPASTVRTRTHRGLMHLREQLDADHDGNRRAWQALLLPLLPTEALPPPVPIEATAAASKSGLLWTAAVLTTGLLVGGIAHFGGERS